MRQAEACPSRTRGDERREPVMADIYETVEKLTKSFQERLTVHTAYGEPITSNGVTVVPVARVRFGFGGGGGGGTGSGPGKPGYAETEIEQSGSGGGGGGGGGGFFRRLGRMRAGQAVGGALPRRRLPPMPEHFGLGRQEPA